jgi:6-phosphogluconolactonase
MVYRLDPAAAKLTPNDPPAAAVPPGGGPRHLSFHPSGKYAYVNNELNGSVTAFAWDAERGALKQIHTVPTLPADFAGKADNTTAQILVHPSGKFVYVSNRGHDSIAAFTVDEGTGKLTAAGHAPTGGKTPRNFNIDPTGKWMIVANQATDSLVLFRIDQETGALEQMGDPVEVPTPVCVTFLAPDW